MSSKKNEGGAVVPGERARKGSPSKLCLYALLVLAVTMCSSAGTVFLLMSEVPPFLRASWRLYAQTIVQIVPFVCEYRKLANKQGDDTIAKWRQHFLWMLLSGFFLGLHFASWVWSLEHTSLAHSLLWVTMYPIVLNSGHWVCFLVSQYLYLKWKEFFEKPTWLETAGSIVGIGGAIVMLADVTVASSPNEKSPTIVGDMAAFMGAVTMCVYLLVGRWMRKWCPIWLYMTPVAFFAALTCTVASALFEGMSWGGLGATSWFGFLSPLYILFAFYLGGGAGVGGHTLLNYLLTFLSTLVVSTSLLLEPLVGSLLGACFGLQSLPGLYTILGTPVLFAGLGMIIAGEQRRVTARKVTEQEAMSVAKKNDVEIEIEIS
jgi:drug/metabolite transporter (DMT)-like permease